MAPTSVDLQSPSSPDAPSGEFPAASAAPTAPVALGQPGRKWVAGSLRERRPGVWEIRIAVGRDPVTQTPQQRSFTVHGTRADAERYRDGVLAEDAPARLPSAAHLDLARLLQAWLEADHDWKPSTRVGYRSVARFLAADPLGAWRAGGLTPRVVRAALARWDGDGASVAVTSGRFRVLRAALG